MAGNPKEDKVVEFIPKPSTFSLDKFKSKRAAAVASVETLQRALPHHSIAAGQRLRSPASRRGYLLVAGALLRKRADQRPEARHAAPDRRGPGDAYLPSGKIQRFRLALATKPFDVFFLCHVRPGTRTTPGTPATCRPARQAKTRGCKPPAERKRASKLQDRFRARPRCLPRTEVADAIARRPDRHDLRRPHDRSRRPSRPCCA